jgi:hypothetical protein
MKTIYPRVRVGYTDTHRWQDDPRLSPTERERNIAMSNKLLADFRKARSARVKQKGEPR